MGIYLKIKSAINVFSHRAPSLEIMALLVTADNVGTGIVGMVSFSSPPTPM